MPSNIDFVEKLSENIFVDDNELDYFKIFSKNGKKVPKEVKDKIKNSPSFKKCTKLIVTYAPFYKDKNWGVKLENWVFIYSGDEKSWYIVGDNPIIVKGDSDRDFVNYLKEFVFPISGKILLININKPINKELPPEFIIQFNTTIIERAQRFVACQNRDFLEALIKDYKIHIQFGKTNTIITDIFNMLEQ